MTPEQEQALLDQTAERIRIMTETAFKEMMRRIRAGESPRDAIASATATFQGEYYAELSSAFSVMLATSIGQDAIKKWPVGKVALSERLYAQTQEVNAVVTRIISEHRQAFVQARELSMQIYEGYEFKADPLKVKAQLPKYLRAALRDPAISQGLSQVFARIRASQLKTPALRAAYLQAIDAVEANAGFNWLQRIARVAWYERNRYFANRIAQTELHRSYEDQKAIEMMDDSELVWVQIRMSATHPKVDVCFRAGTMVLTTNGEKPIEDVLVGDYAFTHQGRFRKVSRIYKNNILRGSQLKSLTIESNQCREVVLTPCHPVLSSSGWIQAGDLRTGSFCLSVDASCLCNQPVHDVVCIKSSSFLGNWQEQDQKKVCVSLYGEHVNHLLFRKLHMIARYAEAPNAEQSIVTYISRKLLNFLLSSWGYFCQSLTQRLPPLIQVSGGTCLYGAPQSLGYPNLIEAGKILSNISFHAHEEQTQLHKLGISLSGTSQNNTSELVTVLERVPCISDTFSQSLHSSSDINVCMISQTKSILSDGEFVYNLEVEEDNSYVANGLVVHNCDYHARMDRYGQGPGVYPKAEAPKPPFHPFCLSGDTLITASGRIAAVSKRWFDGYVVVITTATGKHITATINHPILTRGGWIAAGLLNLGDEVVCRVAADGVGSDVIINDQHQDVPTSIAEIADAFFGSSQVTPTEVPVSAEDFHGDGVAGQVAVIGTDSKLGDWVDAGFPEHAQHHDFSGACPTHGRLLGNGICNFGGEASSRASKSGMGISGQGGSLGIAESRHSDSAGIAAASNADSAPIEVVNDSGSADADPFGYREAGFAAGIRGNNSSANLGGDDASFLAADGERVGPAAEFEPALNKSSFYGFSADSMLASKIIKGETGAIVFEAIVNIKFSFWSGHVYNLDTEYGHYTSNGIITHNCRCRIVPRYDIYAAIPQRERNGADRIFMRSLSQYDQRLVAGSRERLQRFHDGETIESIHDQATRKEYRLKRVGDAIKPLP